MRRGKTESEDLVGWFVLGCKVDYYLPYLFINHTEAKRELKNLIINEPVYPRGARNLKISVEVLYYFSPH